MNRDMILINAQYGLNHDLALDLEEYTLNYRPVSLRKDIMDRLIETIHEMDMDHDLALVSGYRSIQSQVDTWDYCLKHHGSNYTHQYVAKPGHSEHHTGLAIDIGSTMDTIDYIAPILLDNDATKAFKDKLYDHGFILRYPLVKENITKISHEPWHFRYIGQYHSRYVMDHGLAYEEYIDLLKQHGPTNPLMIDDHVVTYGVHDPNHCTHGSTISFVHEGFYVVTTTK